MPNRLTAIVWTNINIGGFALAVAIFHLAVKAGITNPVYQYGIAGISYLVIGSCLALYLRNKYRAPDGGFYCGCADTESNP